MMMSSVRSVYRRLRRSGRRWVGGSDEFGAGEADCVGFEAERGHVDFVLGECDDSVGHFAFAYGGVAGRSEMARPEMRQPASMRRSACSASGRSDVHRVRMPPGPG